MNIRVFPSIFFVGKGERLDESGLRSSVRDTVRSPILDFFFFFFSIVVADGLIPSPRRERKKKKNEELGEEILVGGF